MIDPAPRTRETPIFGSALGVSIGNQGARIFFRRKLRVTH
jgi:hypothetical protein